MLVSRAARGPVFISGDSDVSPTSVHVTELIAVCDLYHVTVQICGYWESQVKNVIRNENTHSDQAL